MARGLFLAVALAALVALAVCQDPNLVNYKPDVYELCALVGENSGCSGCAIGTKGLCTWLAITGDLPAVPFDTVPTINERQTVTMPEPGWDDSVDPEVARTTFLCVPTKYARALIVANKDDGTFVDAADLCPEDPKDEPLLNGRLQWQRQTGWGVGTGVTGTGTWHIQNTSVIYSKTHERKNVEFVKQGSRVSEEAWTVDRTSRWGKAGALMKSYAIGRSFEQANFYWDNIGVQGDCSFINSMNDVQANETIQNSGDNATRVNVANQLLRICPSAVDPKTNTMLASDNRPLWTERDKFCAHMFWDVAASSRCVEYARPVSGICQSAYTLWQINCGYIGEDIHMQPIRLDRQDSTTPQDFFASAVSSQTFLSTYPTPPLDFGFALGLRVVDDSTPWCVQSIPLQITGQMESILGLHKDLRKINDAVLGTTFCPKNIDE